MRNDPTNPPRGLWRLLVLDRDDPGDTRWLIATIAEPGDVQPADPLAIVDEVTTQWVAARHGVAHIQLTPLPHAAVWCVDEAVK